MSKSTGSVEITAVNNFPQIKPGDRLPVKIVDTLRREKIQLKPGNVLVVAQKIVSKAEGRIVKLSSVRPSEFSKKVSREVDKDPRLVEVILSETKKIIRMDMRRKGHGRLIVETKGGLILANAGVDTSNVTGGGSVTLLPLNSDKSADKIRAHIKKRLGVNTAVIISDTVGRPWRDGLVDIAIGTSGIRAIDDRRGSRDSKGFELSATVMATADQVAAAAGLLMDKDSDTPLIILRGLKYSRSTKGSQSLLRKPEEDLFR